MLPLPCELMEEYFLLMFLHLRIKVHQPMVITINDDSHLSTIRPYRRNYSDTFSIERGIPLITLIVCNV